MDFLLRKAITSDFRELIKFYRTEHSAALPAPSARAIGDAMERDQLLLITGNGAIVATAGTFHVSPVNAVHFVAELAGTRVTRPGRRHQPHQDTTCHGRPASDPACGYPIRGA
jgi:hypothetical protein